MISPAAREKIREARILIVDDLEFNIRMLEDLLREAGYRNILGTQKSRLVTDIYRSYKPDLILLDLIMPNVDGFRVMESLREVVHSDSLPVIVLTADSSHEKRIRALEAGARDFLTKPFDPIEVATRIRNLLEVIVLNNELQKYNHILEQKVRERTAQLLLTQKEIIHKLSRAAEYREQGAGLHLIHISQMSACLSKASGLSAEQCELVAASSPMHDIGKIGIPDSILLKPGPLSRDEWEVMHTHTILGAEILSGEDSPLMLTATKIALTHHERWDGTGYPRGLKKEAIPIEGRIVAVADVFDSLLSPRPYKKEWPIEEAVIEIKSLAGSHFDPFLVEKFEEVLPEINRIVTE